MCLPCPRVWILICPPPPLAHEQMMNYSPPVHRSPAGRFASSWWGGLGVGGTGSWGGWGKGSPSPGAGFFCVGVAGDVGWGAPRWAGPAITPLVLVALGTFRRFGLFQAVRWEVMPRGGLEKSCLRGFWGSELWRAGAFTSGWQCSACKALLEFRADCSWIQWPGFLPRPST